MNYRLRNISRKNQPDIAVMIREKETSGDERSLNLMLKVAGISHDTRTKDVRG